MDRKTPNAPASDQVCACTCHKTCTHNASSSSHSSSPQSATEPVHQIVQSTKTIRGTTSSDWTSNIGLNQSDIQRASMPSFAAPQRSTKPSAHSSIHRKKPRNLAPARIKPPAARVAELESMLSKNGNLKIRLPRLEPTPRHITAASVLIKEQPRAPATQSPSAEIPPHQEKSLPPFDPMWCHWRALRDVTFVLDGCIAVPIDDLCALLRFRYAKTDPKMARVGQVHVSAMYDFCKVWGKEMYEKNAWGLIQSQMRDDLRILKEGGERAINWEF